MSAGRKKNDPLDRYWTPRPATVGLFRHWRPVALRKPGAVILEPAAGAGHMLDVLKERFPTATVIGRDISPERDDITRADFLGIMSGATRHKRRRPTAIITNPPFLIAEQFLRQAMREVVPGGFVAFFLRAGFLESKRRANLFEAFPVQRAFFLRSRPHFTGPNNETVGNDSAVYVWLVWQEGERPPYFKGIII